MQSCTLISYSLIFFRDVTLSHVFHPTEKRFTPSAALNGMRSMAKNVSVPPFSHAPPLTRLLLRVSSKSLWKSEATAPNMKWQMELQRPVSEAGIREQPSMPPVRRRTEP